MCASVWIDMETSDVGLPPLLSVNTVLQEMELPSIEPADMNQVATLAREIAACAELGAAKCGVRKRAGRAAGRPVKLSTCTGKPVSVSAEEANNLGKRYTVELTSAAKAARIVRNRECAKRSLHNVKARIAVLEAETAALASHDAALSVELDKAIKRAAGKLVGQFNLNMPTHQLVSATPMDAAVPTAMWT